MAVIPIFPPARDADLDVWTQNFSTKISVAPTSIGLTAGMATAYSALSATWSSAYAASINPLTNSRANTLAKRTAKQALLNGPGGARQLVAIIQAFPGTSDFMRGELALRVRDAEPTPSPTPDAAPLASVVGAFGHTITVRLRDAKKEDSRKKPAGVQGASVFYQIGDTLTANWVFSGNTNRTTYLLDIPDTVPEGETVWITANWFNPAKDTGPAATPIFTKVQYGGAMLAA